MRKCMLARERLRVSEAHSIYRAEILTAHTGTSAEAAEASAEAAEAAAAEAAAAEAAAAVEAATAAEAAAAAGGAAKAAAIRLAREHPRRPSCQKSLMAARTAWPRALRNPPGGQRN